MHPTLGADRNTNRVTCESVGGIGRDISQIYRQCESQYTIIPPGHRRVASAVYSKQLAARSWAQPTRLHCRQRSVERQTLRCTEISHAITSRVAKRALIVAQFPIRRRIPAVASVPSEHLLVHAKQHDFIDENRSECRDKHVTSWQARESAPWTKNARKRGDAARLKTLNATEW